MKAAFAWFSQIFSEADGKGSFARAFGGFIISDIVYLANLGKTIPDPLLTMFWVLVGYQFLGKALNNLSPAAMELAKAVVIRAQQPPQPPKANE